MRRLTSQADVVALTRREADLTDHGRVMSLVTALRAVPRSEGLGMDVTQHGEEAYTNGEGSILVIPDASAVGAPAPAFTPQAVAR